MICAGYKSFRGLLGRRLKYPSRATFRRVGFHQLAVSFYHICHFRLDRQGASLRRGDERGPGGNRAQDDANRGPLRSRRQLQAVQGGCRRFLPCINVVFSGPPRLDVRDGAQPHAGLQGGPRDPRAAADRRVPRHHRQGDPRNATSLRLAVLRVDQLELAEHAARLRLIAGRLIDGSPVSSGRPRDEECLSSVSFLPSLGLVLRSQFHSLTLYRILFI